MSTETQAPTLDAEAVGQQAAVLLGQVQRCQSLDDEAKATRRRAILKAVDKLLSGAVYRVEGETVFFLSESQGRAGNQVWNETNAAGCDCRGAVEGKVCWNKPARLILLALAETPEPDRFWTVCTDGSDHGTPRLVTEAEFEELQENAHIATDDTWWWSRITAEQAAFLVQNPDPVSEFDEPEEYTPAPTPAQSDEAPSLSQLIETLMDPDTSRHHYDVALLAYEALAEELDAHDSDGPLDAFDPTPTPGGWYPPEGQVARMLGLVLSPEQFGKAA